ncbi:hypothetical protein HGM15179_019580 [Zosterops borbonicus]|uniref:Uncharacterized protein n=1 Tax=Zosterops borbonicus TaxID=364589 RepID=A0A8K1DAC2_9PASS|nr:hypothetical protein HGM15179_019580 [Zosterops borbonicus]
MPAGSKMDPLLAKAEPIIDGGNTSEITFKKGEKLLQSRQRKREEMLQATDSPEVHEDSGVAANWEGNLLPLLELCLVLLLLWPGYQYRVGVDLLESSIAEKDLAVLVDSKLSMTHNSVAKKTNRILGCIRKSIASRSWEVILPLYSALARPNLECCVQFWAPQYKRHMELLSYEEKLRELGLLGLEKE